MSFRDTLAPVQWGGQRLRPVKRGALSTDLPASSREFLGKLGLDPDRWPDAVLEFSSHFFTGAGSEECIRACGRRRGFCTGVA